MLVVIQTPSIQPIKIQKKSAERISSLGTVGVAGSIDRLGATFL